MHYKNVHIHKPIAAFFNSFKTLFNFLTIKLFSASYFYFPSLCVICFINVWMCWIKIGGMFIVRKKPREFSRIFKRIRQDTLTYYYYVFFCVKAKSTASRFLLVSLYFFRFFFLNFFQFCFQFSFDCWLEWVT